MEILVLKDEAVQLIPEAESLPQIKEFKKRAMQRKKFIDDAFRFIFYMYSRKSVFRALPPTERKDKVFETFFPRRKKNEFEDSKGFKEFVDWYIDFTMTWKEKMYENHLSDIETMAENISKISFVKKKKIVRTVKVQYGKDWFDVDIDTEIEIDNTSEKLAAMDLMTRLIEKEQFLKKKIEEEYVKRNKKQEERRLFDVTTR